MKKFFYLLICLTLAACGSGKTSISSNTSGGTAGTAGVKFSARSILSEMETGRYVQGELLVKFKPNVSTAALQKIHEVVGASVIKKYSFVPNLEHIKLPQGMSVRDAVVQYMADPDVEYAEPNYIVHIASVNPFIPNDTYFGDQWALRNTGKYANGTYNADMKGALAWNFLLDKTGFVGNRNIKVAVLDTGIDYNHPDLVGNIWSGIGYNFVTCVKFNTDGTCDPSNVSTPNDDPMDDNGHGTHVAGIIGAVGDNNMGVAGVMWDVSLMAIKVFNADGEGKWSDVIEGIQYAVQNGARVINASFGFASSSPLLDSATPCADISNTTPADILLVAAAGNEGSNNDLTPFYPASCDLPNIISVAATDQNDNLVPFSNFGPNSVDIAAPGTYIISTLPDSGYETLEFDSGTSMAAPYVSGVVGLMMTYYDGSNNTYFTPSQIRDTILGFNDVEEDGYPGLKTLKGKIKTQGRLDALWEIASLATPSHLKAEARFPGLVNNTTRSVYVKWTDESTGEDGFKLERSTDGTHFSPIDPPLPANSTSYSDTDIARGTTYYYKIKAYNWISESFYATSQPITVGEVDRSDSGGGGCSVGGRPNVPTAVADVVVLLIPVAIVALARRRREKKSRDRIRIV